MSDEEIIKLLMGVPEFDEKLSKEIFTASKIMNVPENQELMREGQYIKAIPFVLKGLIKVYTRYKEKELLLYYIQPNQSCIMSFSSGIINQASKIYAVTEEEAVVLLMPVEKVLMWTKKFPGLNDLFFHQFNLRYSELLDTINHLIYDKLDQRLYHFLQEKSKLTKRNPIVISHRQIAQELGTSREVISRTVKKLEMEFKVKQEGNAINILQCD
jgi:CRP/FNR family transcriptional regulator